MYREVPNRINLPEMEREVLDMWESEEIFHKNNLANLITLCEKCHNEFHKSKTQHKKVKTSKGYQIQEI